MINSEFEKFQQSQDAIVSQPLEVLLRYLKRDGYRLHDLKHADCMRVQDKLDSIQKGHSKNYFKGIQPVFDLLISVKGSTGTLESPSQTPPLPLPPPKLNPNLDFLAHLPAVQGFFSSHSTPQLNSQRSIDPQIKPLPASPAFKSTPSSVTSSPAMRLKSLLKPRLLLGNNLLSSISGGRPAVSLLIPNRLPSIRSRPSCIATKPLTASMIFHDLCNHMISAQDEFLKRHEKLIMAISGGM
ncbi:hypothetical protein PCANC_23705 [Puccinia coronata f. sp. avenae]|uniref:Fatty acid synthase type I helical domain-containing protein n=1 Tax=Puccinia coronata f. sp. avenae TaxID=200324 RepID=A0A2N5UDB9_9BASI|nr:hypothetical protein PCANC_23705 [Puccinia coronata f. sp. avenae]